MSSMTSRSGAFASEKSHPLVFRGTSGEFMRIWWVNLLLTICTMGIYSAWAKVRTRKWFYGNTELDGSTFNYHGDPKAILKGRLLVVGVYLFIVLASEFLPLLGTALMVLVFLLLPWVIVRSLRFNARNTSYRGVRMDFANDFAGAFLLFALLLPLVVLTLGLAWPWWKAAFLRFLAQHRYGTAAFRASLPVGAVYGVYLRAVAVLVLLSVLFAVVVVGAGLHKPLGDAMGTLQALHAARAEAQTINDASDGEQHGEAPAEDGDLFAGDEEPTDDAAMGDQYDAAVREAIARSQAEWEAGTLHDPVPDEAAVEEPAQTDAAIDDDAYAEGHGPSYEPVTPVAGGEATLDAVAQFVLLAFAGFYALALLAFLAFGAYIDARLTNLLWNGLQVGAVTFSCALRARDLLWLRVSNFLLCVVTLFIAYPVTRVRNARYRLSRMTVEGNLDGFVAAQVRDAGALGEEAGDLLDIDIAL